MISGMNSKVISDSCSTPFIGLAFVYTFCGALRFLWIQELSLALTCDFWMFLDLFAMLPRSIFGLLLF